VGLALVPDGVDAEGGGVFLSEVDAVSADAKPEFAGGFSVQIAGGEWRTGTV
jgi:hypothetical protein